MTSSQVVANSTENFKKAIAQAKTRPLKFQKNQWLAQEKQQARGFRKKKKGTKTGRWQHYGCGSLSEINYFKRVKAQAAEIIGLRHS